jgi:hypothetical protein
MQWIRWRAMVHPILPILRGHFKACSEEYGETAIHTLMSHIREWNYSGTNMTKRWQESSAASWSFRQTSIPRSHRESGTKWYYMDTPTDKFILLSEKFVEIAATAQDGSIVALIGNPGYSVDSETTDDLSFWEDFTEQHDFSFSSAAEQVGNLEKKISRALKPEALENIDHDLFYT